MADASEEGNEGSRDDSCAPGGRRERRLEEGAARENRCVTATEEQWALQAANEKRSTRFDRRIDIVARKALLRVMAKAEDSDVAKAALDWIKFRAIGRPVKDKSADKKQEKIETQTESIVSKLSAELEN